MNILGMFARMPVPGRTKTRLAASIGDEAAAELYGAFVEDLLGRVPSLADEFHLAVTPFSDNVLNWFRPRLPTDRAQIFEQPDVNLGGRIDWFFRQAIDQGGRRIVLIGSDSPDLPSEILRSAFEGLGDADMVVSPATDGGYVLIGLNKPPGTLFENIPWSSAATLCSTIDRAREAGMNVRLLQPWYDVDTAQNLGTLISLQKTGSSGNADCPRTMAAMNRFDDIIRTALVAG